MTSRHLAAVPDQPRRAVLYVRVSALMGRGGDDFHSPDVQTAAMRRALPGLREVETVEDIDVSGTTFSRRGLDRIRELVEAGAVDVIAVYDLSRLGRNVLESLQFIKWLTDRGVTIVSACEQIDTATPAGEMMLINLLNIAQFRSREIGRAWRQVIALRQGRGQWHGTPPRGYQRGDDGRLVEDPLLAGPVRKALRDYGDGKAPAKIRRELAAATGITIAASTLRQMLRCDTYRGVVVAADGTRVTDAHPALVDEPTWRRIQARRARAAATPPRHHSPAYSLSGLGRCGRCGGNTSVQPSRQRRRSGETVEYLVLRCRRQYDGAPPCPGCGAPTLAAVEAAVLERVAAYAAELRGDVAAVQARRARAVRAGIDRGTLEREQAEVRQAMVRLTTRWARDQRDDVFEQAMAQLREQEQRLQQRIDQLATTETAPPPEQVATLADELLRLWPELDAEQRNRALRTLIDHVVIRPATRWRQPPAERIEIRWR